MADNTKIEWSEATWNPVTGCTKVSPGCGLPRWEGDKPGRCYAETFAERWRGVPGHAYENGFDLTLRPERLYQPLRWKRPRRIFVNSMSDLFHDGVSDEYIAKVWAVMGLAKHHTFQVLTKRHGRMRSLLGTAAFRLACEEAAARIINDEDAPIPGPRRRAYLSQWWSDFADPLRNVWLGVSVEDQKHAEFRIPALLETPAAIRWISAEPLLGPVDLRNLKARNGALIDCLGGDVKSSSDGEVYAGTPSVLDWVVTGGESGPGARPMHPSWPRSLRDQCISAGVAYLHKQWGEWRPQPRYSTDDRHHVVMLDGRDRGTPWSGWGIDQPDAEVMERVGKKAAGRELDGVTWDQYPTPASRGLAALHHQETP